jgi:membrane protein YdbS with pleckstrin-like domain
MSYVDKVLQPGEEVRYRASRHWISYVPGLLLHLLAGLLWIAAPADDPWKSVVMLLAGLSAAAALVIIVRAWFQWWITEIAVTNRRIIYKTGFIRRQTNEMHMDKVESVRVDQSILGRILDYGNVNILGTGEGFEPLHSIDAPLELRNHITGV